MLLFHENKPNDNKGISKHLKCIWNEIFGSFFIVSCEKAFKVETNDVYRLSVRFLIP